MSALPVALNLDDEFLIAGPFNLNKRMMRADTVMGERLQLNPRQFRALLMLASNEGENVPFDELRHFMSMPGEEKCPEQDARSIVESLADVVNVSGRGFAWVHKQPQDEYVFETKWGTDWHNPSFELDGKDSLAIAHTAIKKSDNLPGFMLTATTLLVIIAVAVGAYFFDMVNTEQLVYIPGQQIPLAAMPFSETYYPYVGDVSFVLGDNPGILVSVYNSYEGDVMFLMSLMLECRVLFVSPSLFVPSGESQLFFAFVPDSGFYDLRIVMQAFELPGFDKLGETYRNRTVNVE